MSAASQKHIEDSLDKVRILFNRASEKLEALKVGEKIPATKLADDLSEGMEETGATLYPVLLFLFKGYPGVERKAGAKGGLIRVAVTE